MKTAKAWFPSLHSRLAAALWIVSLSSPAFAFSLLGPYADWMDVEKGYRQGNEIGGPMNITEGYRWNIPVLTYGFDRSFTEFFGSNGVAAVTEAIAMFNSIPPASQTDLNSFAMTAWRRNWVAESWAVMDLKSRALAVLLEEMGLADPTRFTFCVRDFRNYSPYNNSFNVIIRNFDPFTTLPSAYVNGMLMSYQVLEFGPTPVPGQMFCDAQEVPVDANSELFSAVLSYNTEFAFNPYGAYVTNLTLEDVAGLKWLLDADHVRHESLPGDVRLADTNGGPLIVSAERPGIDKTTLVPHPFGPLNGRFLPFTNRWIDVYYDYVSLGFQNVERVTDQPDILFTARDLGPWQAVERTGTINWINNAESNGNAGGAGPGVIQGPVTIAFNSLGPFHEVYGRISTNAFLTELDAVKINGWASFNGSTNTPILYPAGQTPFQPTQVHVNIEVTGVPYDLHWAVAGRPFRSFALQTTTNLVDWIALATLTNSGARFDYSFPSSPADRARFFRTVEQP